ncbi:MULTISPECIES: dermonecrotic toxin domain-containing protein [unclassified Pseudomonas]|uniref:dermonecrotic toxin domain-containing protein n=1 Tax=unclassified Pseudomonas TaxID=196821 RepID=UPI0035BEF80F
MTPLQRFESFDEPIAALLSGPPRPTTSHDPRLARQAFFADLASYWNAPGDSGASRKARLSQLRLAQLLAEIDLRIDDQTLAEPHAELLRTCLDRPLPWQREALPANTRPQLYRPRLDITRPNWRGHLPGIIVIVQGGPQGQWLIHGQAAGAVLLCSLAHGIEAFSDLQALHTELCERLDDPMQSRPMLRLFPNERDQDCAHNAERLRYEWLTEDLLDVQVQCLLDAQHGQLTRAWQAALEAGLDVGSQAFDERLRIASDMSAYASSKAALPTRYALLLEKHSPTWFKNTSVQGRTHIIQTMQELIIAIERAGAPGLPTHHQFLEQNSLLAWTREQLRRELRQRHQLDIAAEQVMVSVTMARQVGPVLLPNLPTGYIPAASRPRVGDTIEMVRKTYSLDQLALINVNWLDIDYWLTARVHLADGTTLPGLSAAQAKQLVRELNVGRSYSQFLQTHLVDSPAGQWRQEAYVGISRARMRAEAAKARYAGHFLQDPLEQGYRWAKVLLSYPDSNWRPLVEDNRLSVLQLLVTGQTAQGVLFIVPQTPQMQRFLVYAPDAPDRRPWREYRNTRALLRELRNTPALRQYLVERLPLAKPGSVERLLAKGRLGTQVECREVTGDFLQACYFAEVRAVMAAVDASTNTRLEVLGETALHTLWILLDLISLVLPTPALAALAFGRAGISSLDALEALENEDRVGALKQLVEAFTHASDGINNVTGATVMRRAIRAMPPTPPMALPPTYAARPDVSTLRYRIDGIHGPGVYEKTSGHAGLSLYYIKDTSGSYYQVSFDGYHWRAVDPRQPDAYLKVAVKRREDGQWVVDSPLLWYDGLPDLAALFEQCRMAEAPEGAPVQGIEGLRQADGLLYLLAGSHALPLRAHLLERHYHLSIPGQPQENATAWAILRWQDGQWRVRVRQPGRSSDWMMLPADYSTSRGSS